MKLNLENKIYESNTVLEGHDAHINPEQLKKLWEMLANPYKDNISSIVREITSNCFDSHKEAGVNDAVVITFDKDESGVFIKFSDVGAGLSPERIEKIYINYLTSTKEDSNDYIGAFGIGSKSPLSYTDMFYIDTVYEGIKYSYIMRKGDVKPRIDKIYEVPIQARNGTDIKIYIKSQNAPASDNLYLGDIGSFMIGVKNQLAYFDNVYVQVGDKLNYLTKLTDMVKHLNDFTIYEGEHFIYRSNGSSSLSLCLGKVNYPIDYKIVFPEITTQFPLPIGLRFDIGELMVTYSREDIKYTQEVVEKIREKLKLAVKELFLKIEKQWKEPLEYTDIFEYSNKRNQFGSDYFNYELDDKHCIDIAPFIDQIYTLKKQGNQTPYYNYSGNLINNIRYNLDDYNLPSLPISPDKPEYKKYLDDFVLNIPYFSPFKDYKFSVPSGTNYTNFLVTKKKSRYNTMFSTVSPNNIRSYSRSLIQGIVKNPDTSFSIKSDVDDFVFGKKACAYIDTELKQAKKDCYVFKYERSLKGYKNILGEIKEIYDDKSKWRAFIVLIQKYIEEPILKRMTSLKDIESKATQEWYNQYKKDNGLNKPKNVVKKDPSIVFYKTHTLFSFYSRDNYSKKVEDSGFISNQIDKPLADIVNDKTHVFFTREDTAKMWDIMNLLKGYGILSKKKTSPVFCLVSKTNEKILETKNVMYTLDQYVNDNKEDLIKMYFYTKHLSESTIIDIKKFINKAPNEDYFNKSMVLYYLMGNDLITPLVKKDQLIKTLITNYDAFNSVQYKISDIHDLYKKMVEQVFLNSKIDFKKECEGYEKKCMDDLKSYKDELDAHYKYLSFVYIPVAGTNAERESLAFFYNKIDLLNELKVIKKNSFMENLSGNNTAYLDQKYKELVQKDTILKEFITQKSIGQSWFNAPSSYGSYDSKFRESLLFYLQQYVLYKTKQK